MVCFGVLRGPTDTPESRDDTSVVYGSGAVAQISRLLIPIQHGLIYHRPVWS